MTRLLLLRLFALAFTILVGSAHQPSTPQATLRAHEPTRLHATVDPVATPASQLIVKAPCALPPLARVLLRGDVVLAPPSPLPQLAPSPVLSRLPLSRGPPALS